MIGRLKEVYSMDIVIVVGTLLILAGAFIYARPLLIAPLNGFESSNSSVLFSFERGDAILLDDNSDFTSPDRIPIKNGAIINLKPGIYYWRVDGVLNSEIRKLVVSSVIDLRIRSNADKYELVNEGNVITNVTFYNNESITSSRVIRIHESTPLQGSSILGVQNE